MDWAGTARNHSWAAGEGRQRFLVDAGAQMESRGSRAEGGSGWALPSLRAPVPVQPSPLSCIPAPLTALLCLFTSNTEYASSLRGVAYAILKLKKGAGCIF